MTSDCLVIGEHNLQLYVVLTENSGFLYRILLHELTART